MKKEKDGEHALKKSFQPGLNRQVCEIFAGEYHASRESNIVFTTLLGSCISVCLKDSFQGVCGINHFMLPGRPGNAGTLPDEDTRYGLSAMEKLISDMEKLGARQANLQAKVFGGGQVLDVALNNVARMNVDFILAYMKAERIPLLSSDLGEKYGRKLFFYADTFEVYLKRIQMARDMGAALAREKRFIQWAHRYKELEDKKYMADKERRQGK